MIEYITFKNDIIKDCFNKTISESVIHSGSCFSCNSSGFIDYWDYTILVIN